MVADAQSAGFWSGYIVESSVVRVTLEVLAGPFDSTCRQRAQKFVTLY